MKTALASLAALACLAGGGASAQSLAYGVTLGNIQTVRDAQNGSTITGSLANQSARPINSVMLTFVLYDEQGREIGRVQDGVTGPLAPGQIRLVRAVTPLPAARVTRWTCRPGSPCVNATLLFCRHRQPRPPRNAPPSQAARIRLRRSAAAWGAPKALRRTNLWENWHCRLDDRASARSPFLRLSARQSPWPSY